MPTLIRLLVILLVLAGLGYGAMFALVATVSPKDKDVTIRIPARELVAAPERDPLVRREIDTTRKAEPPAAVEPAPPVDTAPPAADSTDVVTLEPGVE